MQNRSSRLEISIEETPLPDDLAALEAGLDRYARGRVEPRSERALLVVLRDARGRILGGARGATSWRWLHIKHLWVAEEFRGQGWGRLLMEAAEREAVRRGCRHAYLDTFSFQSPGFYQRLGYCSFGELEDFPPGERRIFMRKLDLDRQDRDGLEQRGGPGRSR